MSPRKKPVKPPPPPPPVPKPPVFGSKLYRIVETFAFVAAIAQVLGYMTVELLHRAEVISVNGPHEGFPWGTLIGAVILIAPKLIGKYAAGKALVAVAQGASGNGYGTTGEYSKGGE